MLPRSMFMLWRMCKTTWHCKKFERAELWNYSGFGWQHSACFCATFICSYTPTVTKGPLKHSRELSTPMPDKLPQLKSTCVCTSHINFLLRYFRLSYWHWHSAMHNNVHLRTSRALSLQAVHLNILQPSVNGDSEPSGINKNMKQSNIKKENIYKHSEILDTAWCLRVGICNWLVCYFCEEQFL